jgi:hypothetical protein
MSRLSFHRMPCHPNPSLPGTPSSVGQLRQRRRQPPPSLGPMPQTTSCCGSSPRSPSCSRTKRGRRRIGQFHPQVHRGEDRNCPHRHSQPLPPCHGQFNWSPPPAPEPPMQAEAGHLCLNPGSAEEGRHRHHAAGFARRCSGGSMGGSS